MQQTQLRIRRNRGQFTANPKVSRVPPHAHHTYTHTHTHTRMHSSKIDKALCPLVMNPKIIDVKDIINTGRVVFIYAVLTDRGA